MASEKRQDFHLKGETDVTAIMRPLRFFIKAAVIIAYQRNIQEGR